MHINNNDLEKFQNDVMNTDEMISFLSIWINAITALSS